MSPAGELPPGLDCDDQTSPTFSELEGRGLGMSPAMLVDVGTGFSSITTMASNTKAFVGGMSGPSQSHVSSEGL